MAVLYFGAKRKKEMAARGIQRIDGIFIYMMGVLLEVTWGMV
jgi:hypothetical protein